MTRDKDIYPVRWAGGQAIMTLPEQIDVSNAGQIREQLLLVINRGAATLIADMTATLSCDHAGADALVRAYQRAVTSGTPLRLVVTTPIVQRVLSFNGLDRLIPIYPSLEAAIAAGAKGQESPAWPGTGVLTAAAPEATGLSPAAHPADRSAELLDWVAARIFDIGVILQAAIGLPRDAARLRMIEALGRLDDVVRGVLQHMFAERAQDAQPGPAAGGPQDIHERWAQASECTASAQERLAQTAHVLQMVAADTAALLERRADLAGQPARIDYPAEIKRWRAFADQAKQMAKLLEQRP